MTSKPKATKATSAKGRQAGDYTPPILTEPKGGRIPATEAQEPVKED